MLMLVDVMCDVGVFKLVFSLLVMVYGDLVSLLIWEDFFVGGIINLYGIFKFMVEMML